MSIDERIAEALDAAEIGASELADLVSEVEMAAASAAETAVEARSHALDPMVVDPTAARAAMNDAEFTRDRLQTALPQLQARQREVGAAERYKKWAAEYDEVAAEQTALAQELTELYPPFEAKTTHRTDGAPRRRAFDHEGYEASGLGWKHRPGVATLAAIGCPGRRDVRSARTPGHARADRRPGRCFERGS